MRLPRIDTILSFSLALLSMLSVARGDELAEIRFKKLIEARSKAELQALLQPLQKLEKARASCRTEIALGLPPSSCFGVATNEIDKKNLLSACLKRARTSTSVEILRRALRHKPLPTPCQQALDSRLRDLQYMNPSELGPIFELSGHYDWSHAL